MRARNKFGQLILKYVQSEKNVKGLMQQEEIKNLWKNYTNTTTDF